jgi:hypothetical protein
MIMHLGIPGWQYAFTKVGLDPQTLQWFRFLTPERLAIDIENRKNQEYLNKKNQGQNVQLTKNQSSFKFGNDKIKIEGLKRKRRRMKLKAKGPNEQIVEKFNAQSCKTAKYAKSVVKKRDHSEIKSGATAGGGADASSIQVGGGDGEKKATET